MVADKSGNSRLPIYQKLRDKLAREIKSGERKAGERLPSERALAEEMGSARMTVREALLMLEGEGLISRRKNRGWYVDPKRVRYDPTNHVNIYRMVKSWGANPAKSVPVGGKPERRSRLPE